MRFVALGSVLLAVCCAGCSSDASNQPDTIPAAGAGGGGAPHAIGGMAGDSSKGNSGAPNRAGSAGASIVPGDCTFEVGGSAGEPPVSFDDGVGSELVRLPDIRGPLVPALPPLNVEGSPANAEERVFAVRANAEGLIFALTATASESKIRCLDAEFAEVWQVREPNQAAGYAFRDLAVSNDGNVVAVGDSGVSKYASADGELIWNQPEHPGYAIASSPNGSTVALMRDATGRGIFEHDADGNLDWFDSESATPLFVAIDADSNIFVTFSNEVGGDARPWISKYDGEGKGIWTTGAAEVGQEYIASPVPPTTPFIFALQGATAPGAPAVFLRSRAGTGSIGALNFDGGFVWFRQFSASSRAPCAPQWTGQFAAELLSGTQKEVNETTGYVSPMLVTSDAVYVSGLYVNVERSGAKSSSTWSTYVARHDFSGNVEWFDEFRVSQDEAPSIRDTFGPNSGLAAELPNGDLVLVQRAVAQDMHGGWVLVKLDAGDGALLTSRIPD
jgi:outer membrane protein assembly factor BamB